MREQLPGRGQIFLDHVGWYVPDLEAAAGAFDRLGFPLTPCSVHGDRDPRTGRVVPLGSANRLAVLHSGYLEFLSAVEATDSSLSRHLRERMARYVGIHLTAFTVRDAAAEAVRLAADGIALQPTVNLRRTAEAADGSRAEVGFTVVRARFDFFPEGRIQTLTHLTPEQIWQERYMARENAIHGLTEIVFSVPDPVASAQRLAKFTGRPAGEMAGGTCVRLDRGQLSFYQPQDIARWLGFEAVPAAPAAVAVGLASNDLAQTRDFFSARGVSLVADEADRLVVAPDVAMGAALIIHPLAPLPSRPV